MSGEDHGAGEVSGEFERGQSVPRSSVIPGYLSCEQGLKNVLFIVLAGHLSYVVPFFNFLLSQMKPLCTPASQKHALSPGIPALTVRALSSLLIRELPWVCSQNQEGAV